MEIVFDQHYQGYDSWYQTPLGQFVDGVETVACWQLLAPTAGQHLLDIGCGTGNFSLKLARLGCRVIGVDIATNMLAQARAKAAAAALNIDFRQMDVRQLEFADNSFDAALSMAAFEFIADPEPAYRQIMRVLKPGGRLVIGTIQLGGAWQQLYSSSAFSNSAYARACFKSREQLQALDPAALVEIRECLFTPPGLAESAYGPASEAAYAETAERGGFVCVSFRKPLS